VRQPIDHPCKRSSRRSGFSVLELTITLLVVAISASVAIPRWVEAAERQHLRSATRLIESDLRTALRSAAIRSRTHILTIQAGTGTLTISPALAAGSAPASEAIDYALRFNGLVFVAANLDGGTTCKIDMYQRLLNPNTNQPLATATLQVQIKGKRQTLDLLSLLQTSTASGAVTSAAVTP
jgi:type II secretory pathway pseudopilin PulG